MPINKNTIMKQLDKVIDPEIGIPITKMKLIDKIQIKNGNVVIGFHLTMPYCPPMFATQMASDIKKYVSKIKGVKSVKIRLRDHYMADQINKQINKS